MNKNCPRCQGTGEVAASSIEPFKSLWSLIELTVPGCDDVPALCPVCNLDGELYQIEATKE